MWKSADDRTEESSGGVWQWRQMLVLFGVVGRDRSYCVRSCNDEIVTKNSAIIARAASNATRGAVAAFIVTRKQRHEYASTTAAWRAQSSSTERQIERESGRERDFTSRRRRKNGLAHALCIAFRHVECLRHAHYCHSFGENSHWDVVIKPKPMRHVWLLMCTRAVNNSAFRASNLLHLGNAQRYTMSHW